MEVTVPAAMGGNKDQQMTITLTGPVWIVKDAPGAAEYNRFYLTAAEKGWIFSDPRAAKGQPGQAKAMAEMYKQFAEIGGIAYETEMQIKMGMGGGGAGTRSAGCSPSSATCRSRPRSKTCRPGRSPTSCLHRRPGTS